MGKDLLVLALAMTVNILLGTFHQVGQKKQRFHRSRFLSGLLKAALVAFSFASLSFCFRTADLSALGVTPDMIMNAAILLYTGKDMAALAKILGVEDLLKKEKPSSS